MAQPSFACVAHALTSSTPPNLDMNPPPTPQYPHRTASARSVIEYAPLPLTPAITSQAQASFSRQRPPDLLTPSTAIAQAIPGLLFVCACKQFQLLRGHRDWMCGQGKGGERKGCSNRTRPRYNAKKKAGQLALKPWRSLSVLRAKQPSCMCCLDAHYHCKHASDLAHVPDVEHSRRASNDCCRNAGATPNWLTTYTRALSVEK